MFYVSSHDFRSRLDVRWSHPGRVPPFFKGDDWPLKRGRCSRRWNAGVSRIMMKPYKGVAHLQTLTKPPRNQQKRSSMATMLVKQCHRPRFWRWGKSVWFWGAGLRKFKTAPIGFTPPRKQFGSSASGCGNTIETVNDLGRWIEEPALP